MGQRRKEGEVGGGGGGGGGGGAERKPSPGFKTKISALGF